MLDKKIIAYLEDNEEFKLLPEYQEKFKRVLREYGVREHSAVIDLMGTYAGEFNGNEAFIINVAEDLADYEKSVTKHLIENEHIDQKYISLFNLEFDDYLLYNKDDDSVVLINSGNLDKLNDGIFDKRWDSFNEFLIDFFGLD
jgi:hypothetical protein